MKKFSKKHIAIFKAIYEKGKYRPSYSDQEQATVTLQKAGLIDWNGSFTGLIFTEQGEAIKDTVLKSSIEN